MTTEGDVLPARFEAAAKSSGWTLALMCLVFGSPMPRGSNNTTHRNGSSLTFVTPNELAGKQLRRLPGLRDLSHQGSSSS